MECEVPITGALHLVRQATPDFPSPSSASVHASMFLRRLFNVFLESLSGEERDYTAMAMRRAIVLLSIPMIMEMGMEALFALVDTFFVSKLGVVATATVGLTETLMVPVYSIAWGLGMGITAVVARRTGEKNKEGARVAAGQSLFIALVCGLVLAVPSVVFAPQLLQLMGAEPEVMVVAGPYAVSYTHLDVYTRQQKK